RTNSRAAACADGSRASALAAMVSASWQAARGSSARASRTSPGPDSTASALTAPHSSRSRANTSISSAACGPNEACPPSLATTCQRPSADKSAATPSPVPGPSTTLTPARAATGLPSGRVCAAPSCGSAQAIASKSLSTRSCENPKRLANSRRRKRQLVRLGSAIPPASAGPGPAGRRRAGPGAGSWGAPRARRVEAGARVVLDSHPALGRPGRIGEREPALATADIGEKARTHRGYPRLITISYPMGCRMGKPQLQFFPCCSCSIRPRQAEDVLGEVGQDQIGRDRRGLIEPRLAELALDVELLGKAEAAVGLQAHVGRGPGGVGGKELSHVGLGAALAPGLIEGGGRAHHQLGRAHLCV